MRTYIIRDKAVKAYLGAELQKLLDLGMIPEVTVNDDFDPARSADANALMWKILTAISTKRQWPVNGEMTYMRPDDWKDVLTAAFERDTQPRVAKGFGGGVVMLGRRTSKYGRAKFSGWLEFLMAAASELDVEWEE